MRNPVQITEVKIRLTNGDRVRARVSITINDSLVIGELKVICLRKGYFVEFPKKKQPDGSYAEIAAPTNAETRRMIEQAIFAEFEKITGEQVTRRV